MLVGLTYDLKDDYLAQGFSDEEVAEFDRLDTIEGIESALHELGYSTDRIGHIKNLTARLAQGNRWDIVFNIAEGMYGLGREAQIPALLDAYKIPYTFSDPVVLALTLHKGMTKHVVRAAGIATPDFAVISNESDLKKVNLPYPLFAKPVGEGTGKGISSKSRVNTHAELAALCKDLLTHFKQPVLVETFLSGREFTVGITGEGESTRSVGIVEVILHSNSEQDAYSYLNKKLYEDRVKYLRVSDPEAKAAEELSIAAWKALGCRDAGRVDVRSNGNGQVNFIEVNPLAGLNPVHSDLPIICQQYGIPFRELIRSIMDHALRRIS